MRDVFTNTARITHWLFAHLLCDRAAHKRLQDSLDRAVAEEFQGSEDALLEDHPRTIAGPPFAFLDSALVETGRLHVLPSSYRGGVEFPAADGKRTPVVRKGEMAVANVASPDGDERWIEDPKTFRIGS